MVVYTWKVGDENIILLMVFFPCCYVYIILHQYAFV